MCSCISFWLIADRMSLLCDIVMSFFELHMWWEVVFIAEPEFSQIQPVLGEEKPKSPFLDAFSEMKCAWFFFRQLNFVQDVCSDRWCPCMLEEACISFFWDHGSVSLMLLHWLFFLNIFPPVQSSSLGGERSRLIDTLLAQAFCWSLKSLGGQGFFFWWVTQHWPGRTVQVLLTIQTDCIGSCVLDSTV